MHENNLQHISQRNQIHLNINAIVISRSSFWKYISQRCARERSSWNSLRWGMPYEALSIKHESNYLC